MNNTTTPEPQLPYAVIYGSIMSTGLPFNAVAIWIFLRHHSLKSPNVIFMLNLAISDLLLASSLPLKVYYFATGTWPLGHTVCILVQAFFNANIRSSSIFITLISADRLLAVVYPLRSRLIRTALNATKATILVWIFVIMMAIPICVMFGKDLKESDENFCFERPWNQQRSQRSIRARSISGIFQLTLVLLLLIVNVVSAILVSLTLRRNVKDSPKVNNKINVMLLFVMSLIMFTVCFLPTTIDLLTNDRRTYLECIAATNSCLDPLLYYFSLDAFWKKKEERSQLKHRNVV